jgi:hypothetical protein
VGEAAGADVPGYTTTKQPEEVADTGEASRRGVGSREECGVGETAPSTTVGGSGGGDGEAEAGTDNSDGDSGDGDSREEMAVVMAGDSFEEREVKAGESSGDEDGEDGEDGDKENGEDGEEAGEAFGERDERYDNEGSMDGRLSTGSSNATVVRYSNHPNDNIDMGDDDAESPVHAKAVASRGGLPPAHPDTTHTNYWKTSRFNRMKAAMSATLPALPNLNLRLNVSLKPGRLTLSRTIRYHLILVSRAKPPTSTSSSSQVS